MKPIRLCLVALALTVASELPSHARQVSVGRIRQSLDKATGGATSQQSKPAPGGAPAAPQFNAAAAAQTQKERDAQAAAIAAAQNRRNQKALVGADDRVVSFLKQRIGDGSADAAHDLAKRHEEGKGVPEDATEARRLHKLAAERGNEDAKKWVAEHPEPKPAIVKAEAKPAAK